MASKWNLDVADAYLREFDAACQADAMMVAQKEALAYGGDVFLFKGPIVSGTRPVCGFDSAGEWFSTAH